MEKMDSWIEENMEEADCDLRSMSDKSFLTYDEEKLRLHQIDKMILCLERILILKSKWGAFLYPIDRTDVSVLMALEAVYAKYSSEESRDKVLLISENIAIREIYPHLKTNGMIINEFFPLGVVRFDGSVKRQIKTKYFDRKNTIESVFIHTSNYHVLPNDRVSKEVACAVIDISGAATSDLENAIDWARKSGIPSVIFLENDPLSQNLKILQSEQIPIWMWTNSDLINEFRDSLNISGHNPFAASGLQIRNLMQGVKKEFIEINDKNINPSLREALKLYFELKKILQDDKSDILFRGWRVYSAARKSFEAMLAPVSYTEDQCKQSFLSKTIQSRIQDLESFRNALQKYDPLIASIWDKTYSLIRLLNHELSSYGNPKYERLKDLVKRSINNKERMLIINYSEPYARALIEALSKELFLKPEELNARGIYVASILNKNINDSYDICIIFGAPPWWARNVLRTAVAKRIIFLVYPSEKALLKYEFENEAKSIKDLSEFDSRRIFLERVFGKKKAEKAPLTRQEEKNDWTSLNLSESELKEEEKFQSLFESSKIDEELPQGYELEEEYDPSDFENYYGGDIIVKCCKIEFDGGSSMYVKISRRIPVFKDGKDIFYYDIKKVKRGDFIIIIKNNLRNNLAREIINKTDKHPKMSRLKFLVDSWTTILRKGMEENKDSEESFIRKINLLQEREGCVLITNPLTIQLWREGYTIGPQNPKNLKFIGEIYKNDFLINNYREVSAAISRLRSIHQRLLRNLNDLILKASTKSLKNPEDEVIDEEFNLHLEDFVGIIAIEKVKSIDLDKEIERSKLDRIIR